MVMVGGVCLWGSLIVFVMLVGNSIMGWGSEGLPLYQVGTYNFGVAAGTGKKGCKHGAYVYKRGAEVYDANWEASP